MALLVCVSLASCDGRGGRPFIRVAASGDAPSRKAVATVRAVDPALTLPPAGKMYHGVFPGSLENPGSEDGITPADLDSYEAAVGHRVAWVYFSHEWSHGEAFPLATASWIRERGSVPFIRLMMRTVAETGRTTDEQAYALTRIVAGTHDAALAAWGDAARAFGSPLIVEWGTEMNGSWFPWNGSHNGGGARGVSLFRDAYRHVVDVVRSRGAAHVTWVFHVNGDDQPAAEWNRFENYYPGDAWVDWVGLSAYGALTPSDPCPSFVPYADEAVARLGALAPGKPIMVFEFGTTKGGRGCSTTPSEWARAALAALAGGRWPSVRGFSWWNEKWQNAGSLGPTNMRVQDVPGLAAEFSSALGRGITVDRPVSP
jgi:hypothetical protein